MARGSALLADVKDPGLGRQAFSMMSQMGIGLEPRAGLSDERSVARDLHRSELCSSRANNGEDIRLGGFGQDKAHDSMPSCVCLALVHECVEGGVRLELRAMLPHGLHARIPCRAKHRCTVGVGAVTLLQGFHSCSERVVNGPKSTRGNQRLDEAGSFLSEHDVVELRHCGDFRNRPGELCQKTRCEQPRLMRALSAFSCFSKPARARYPR